LRHEEGLDVVAIGAAAVDIVARVERLPEPDQMVFVQELKEFPGGSTANVAVALAKLGCRVGFLGKVGGDRFGRLLLEDFKRAGVDASRVIVEGSARSASTFIAVDKGGRRVIYSLRGKALLESPEELDLSYIMKAQVIYVGEAYPSVVADPLSHARGEGVLRVYNLGLNFSIFGGEALEIVRNSDVILMSSKELSLLGSDVEDVARSLLREGPSAVVITMGQEGSMLIQEGRIERVPAFKTRVLDTTGAGDAFAAGFIYGLLRKWDLSECMRFGNAVAAIKVSSYGPRCGLPTEKEVLNFLAKC
jgi:ribokinase